MAIRELLELTVFRSTQHDCSRDMPKGWPTVPVNDGGWRRAWRASGRLYRDSAPDSTAQHSTAQYSTVFAQPTNGSKGQGTLISPSPCTVVSGFAPSPPKSKIQGCMRVKPICFCDAVKSRTRICLDDDSSRAGFSPDQTAAQHSRQPLRDRP